VSAPSTSILTAALLAVIAGCEKPPPERPLESIDLSFVNYATVRPGVVHLTGTSMAPLSIEKCTYRVTGPKIEFDILARRTESFGGSASITTHDVDCRGPILAAGSYDTLGIDVRADGTGGSERLWNHTGSTRDP
jgi:hypothetical protein